MHVLRLKQQTLITDEAEKISMSSRHDNYNCLFLFLLFLFFYHKDTLNLHY